VGQPILAAAAFQAALEFPAIFHSSTHYYMWGRRFRLPTRYPNLTEASRLFVTWRLAGSIPRARLLRTLAKCGNSSGRL